MSRQKECPYYIVNNMEEFNAAVAKLGHGQKKPLYPFPCIVGFDDIVFQCAVEPTPPYTDKYGTTYVYQLHHLQP